MDTSMMVTPDIASMSIAMAQSRVQDDIGVAVLSKALDNYQDSGAEMTKMMERSVAPYLGANIDLSV